MKISTSARSPLSPTLWPTEAFVWWQSLILAIMYLGTTLLPPAIFLAFLFAFQVATANDLRHFSWPLIAAQFVVYAFELALLGTLLPAIARRSFAQLGLHVPRMRDLGWGALGALAMVALGNLAGALQSVVFHLKPDEVQVQWLRDAHGSLGAGLVLLACLAAPFFEELAFRGFIFNALLRYAPAWFAVVLSSIMFGFMHWQPGNAGAIAPLAAVGVVLAVVYYRTGSLVASMIAHALFNLLTVVLVLALRPA